jgi:hypothetical protein
MRRRAAALLIATLTAGALVGGTFSEAGAQGKKAPLCKGKAKKKAIAAIEDAWLHFLDYETSPTADSKFDYIQFMSPPAESEELRTRFVASAEANAASAATTSVQVNSVKCAGKRSADVLFDLVLNGEPAPGLAPPGTAILEKGSTQWKVTGETLCNMQALGDPTVLESGPCSEILLEGAPADVVES